MIQAAVDYWAQFVTHATVGGHRAERATNKQIQSFKKLLTDKLNTAIAANPALSVIAMSTDYKPEGILAEALLEAGVTGTFHAKDVVAIDLRLGKVVQRQVRGESWQLYPERIDLTPKPHQETSRRERKLKAKDDIDTFRR